MQCSSISAIPRFDRMVLLIRHAERSAVTDLRTHGDVMLTRQGLADARSLGRMLGRLHGGASLFHSPIARCRQTAESLAAGAIEAGAQARVDGPLEFLGTEFTGGDPVWLNQRIAAEGHEGFLRLWFDGRFPADAIAPIARAASFQMRYVLRQLEDPKSTVTVDVTHDWNLMLLREHYLGLRHEEVGVTPYLDSIAVLRRDGVTTVWSHGRSAPLEGDAVAEA